MFALFLLVVYLGARMNTAYHPHLRFKKYVVIKNRTAARLLIDQSDLVNSRIKNAAANRNKLLCAGIVFYVLFLLLIVFSAVLFLMPEIPAERFTYDSNLCY